MDRCEYWSLDQPAVGQRHEVVVTVYEIKLRSALERFGDVQVFDHFGIDRGILFISTIYDGVKVSAGYRISGRKQRYIPPTRDKAFSDIARHRLPGSVTPRRRSPCHGRQDSHSLVIDVMLRHLCVSTRYDVSVRFEGANG